MLTSIWADDPGFKTISLKPGLNLLLADRHEMSSAQQTRNGAGKSSLVLLIHFLLGADASTDSIFRSPDLETTRFSGQLTIGDRPVTISRTGSDPAFVELKGLSGSDGPERLRNDEWKSILGTQLLKLPSSPRFGPTWRSCFSYYARRIGSGGLNGTFRQSGQQQKWDEQVNLSYLLGLDWRAAQAWQEVRVRESSLKQLRRLAKQGAVNLQSPTAIRTELAVAERELRRVAKSLDDFHFVDNNEQLQQQAAALGREIAQVADANTSRREYIAELSEALESEAPPVLVDIKRVYDEVGLVIPDTSLRRFDEVREFHDSVIQNRITYLEEERRRTREEFETANRHVRDLDSQRARLLRLLRSTGGFETLADMQAEAGRLAGLVDILKERLTEAEELAGDEAELGLERQQLLASLLASNRERGEWLRSVIATFEEYSGNLYVDRTGSLNIGAELNGPEFSVNIEGERSRGIQSMQTYCFDQTLMAVAREQGFALPLLAHDSHLFDGVDERQVAFALAKGHEASLAGGWPYLVTLNSDNLPHQDQWPDGFDVAEHTMDIRLTDQTESGGLFGKRFS